MDRERHWNGSARFLRGSRHRDGRRGISAGCDSCDSCDCDALDAVRRHFRSVLAKGHTGGVSCERRAGSPTSLGRIVLLLSVLIVEEGKIVDNEASIR